MGVNVDRKTKKLIIRFRVSGYPKQFYLSSGLKDNKSNRAIVDSRWELIQREISLNEFDHTLDRYKFGAKKVSIPQKTYNLSELWDIFTRYQEQFLEQSTIQHKYTFTARVISGLTQKTEVEIRNYLLEKYSYFTARTIIDDLSRCLEWAINEQLTTDNPFQKLKLPKQKKSSQEEISAYTLNQRNIVIAAFENHYKYSHYVNIIKFLFLTGCRPGEAFALTWADISHDCTKITITKSFASRIKTTKSTKNCKRRVFPAESGGKLHKLLVEMRSIHPTPETLVFRSITGKQLSLKVLEKVWRGYTVSEYSYPGVVRELADKNIIPYLKLYSTRHTFATWAIALGASPDKVAYWLGDDVRTILAYYCHPEISKSDCPDF